MIAPRPHFKSNDEFEAFRGRHAIATPDSPPTDTPPWSEDDVATAERIKSNHRLYLDAKRRGAAYAAAVAEDLILMKERHKGRYLAYVRECCGIKPRQAQRYIEILERAKTRPEILEGSQREAMRNDATRASHCKTSKANPNGKGNKRQYHHRERSPGEDWAARTKALLDECQAILNGDAPDLTKARFARDLLTMLSEHPLPQEVLPCAS